MIVAAVSFVCDVPAIAKSEMWIYGTCISDRGLKPALPSANTSSAYVTLKVDIIPWQLAWIKWNLWWA